MVVFPAPSLSLAAGPSLSRGHSACSPSQVKHQPLPSNTSCERCFLQHYASELSANTLTHIDTGVIGQYAVVGQRDILLLPLFVERIPAAFQQDALEATKIKE